MIKGHVCQCCPSVCGGSLGRLRLERLGPGVQAGWGCTFAHLSNTYKWYMVLSVHANLVCAGTPAWGLDWDAWLGPGTDMVYHIMSYDIILPTVILTVRERRERVEDRHRETEAEIGETERQRQR